MKNLLLKNYKALFLGGIVTAVLVITRLLSQTNFFVLYPLNFSEPVAYIINILAIVFCWWLVSFLISRYSVYKVGGLVSILIAVIILERTVKISENPITTPLIILFWLGAAYLIIPVFFKKYQTIILVIYGLVVSYHFFVFLTTPNYGADQRLYFAKFMLIPLPVFAALWIYEQWRWFRTLKMNKTRAELALLKSQVNPHFFFNTLNNLYGLVVEKSPQAPKVVLQLSDMMRYTIYEGKKEWVDLSDEVKYLETYIHLHKIRYQKKVDVQFEHEINQEMQVAPLLFIILLENAFKHGVESLTENAYIHLSLKGGEKQILFKIENNYESNNTGEKTGIGLDNLKKRLELIYPDLHELKILRKELIYTAELKLLLPKEKRK